MANGALSERIENPEIWNLLLRIGAEAVDAVIYSIVGENSLVYQRFFPDTTTATHLKAIENIVYDNPALLSDFRRTYCVVGTRNYAVIPAECDSAADRRLLFDTAFPKSGLEMHVDATGTLNAQILTGIEPDMLGFINRTFQRVSISSHIASLCRYASAKSGQSNGLKMLVNVRQRSIDVIVTDGRKLVMANTFSFSNPEDAVYYILATRKQLGLDPRSDELLITGDQTMRETLIPMLRTYISRVMPAIFPPQMFKAGKDAMLVPFDLIITPLCE